MDTEIGRLGVRSRATSSVCTGHLTLPNLSFYIYKMGTISIIVKVGIKILYLKYFQCEARGKYKFSLFKG